MMEHKIQALGRYLANLLMHDYQSAILGGDFCYIRPHPWRHLVKLCYLAMLLAGTLLLTHTKTAPAAVYTGIYFLVGLILTAILWHRSGYSLIVYVLLNGAYAWVLWAAIG